MKQLIHLPKFPTETDSLRAALTGATTGAALVLILYSIHISGILGTPLGKLGDRIIFPILMYLLVDLFAGLLRGLLHLSKKMFSWIGVRIQAAKKLEQLSTILQDRFFRYFVGILAVFGLLLLAPGDTELWYIPLGWCILFGAFIGYALSLQHTRRIVNLSLAISANVVVGIWLANFGLTQFQYKNIETIASSFPVLTVADPGQPGEFLVQSLTYGSGYDRRRLEYGQKVTIRTSPVDASPIWKGYSGFFAKYYQLYWGFTPTNLPLNARVWYPQGNGPFPIVLMVHGNHNWSDYSEPGYAYLGEQLASHGYIAVSVDENFLNGFAINDPGGQEIPARGWVLLKHLELWQQWNQSIDNPFYGKVDFQNIALIGHSNGGEAATSAAYLNTQDHLPSNDNFPLNFHFPIRAIVEIAPSDMVYRPNGKPIMLKDIDLFLLQGAHDSQVMAFSGMGQYDRTSFSPDSDHFKTAWYFYRGNHVKFNTAWGSADLSAPVSWLLNQKPLLSNEEQQQLARAGITAFLEASLKGKTVYRTWFHDLRQAANWLPEDMYVTAYQDSTFQSWDDFQADNDVASMSVVGGKGECFGEIQCLETKPVLRYYNKIQTNRAISLKWNSGANQDSGYRIILPQEYNPSKDVSIVFAVAAGSDQKEPSRLFVQLTDRNGKIITLPLDQIGPVNPSLQTNLYRFPALRDWIGRDEPLAPEIVFQSYELSIETLANKYPDFNATQLSQIAFLVDPGINGSIYLDEIGLRATP